MNNWHAPLGDFVTITNTKANLFTFAATDGTQKWVCWQHTRYSIGIDLAFTCLLLHNLHDATHEMETT